MPLSRIFSPFLALVLLGFSPLLLLAVVPAGYDAPAMRALPAAESPVRAIYVAPGSQLLRYRGVMLGPVESGAPPWWTAASESRLRTAFTRAGHRMSGSPAPDVLHARILVRDELDASILLEVRDSVSGVLLGRVVTTIGPEERWSDEAWPRLAAEGLTQLKATARRERSQP